MPVLRLIVVGGGAAGFFAAISAKTAHPAWEVIILEKTAQLLSKVKVSGGGRCNVTHACFDPKALAAHYPRGNQELIGPFYRFQPRDTMNWFESRGVSLKVERDGRVFPCSDSSQEIIDCLCKESARLGIRVITKAKVDSVLKNGRRFAVAGLEADCLLLASGSSRKGYEMAESLGHTIQEAVPSLFTFNISQFSLKGLAGVAVPRAAVSLKESGCFQSGPILITHWGFSGPAILRLSAWEARFLHACQYRATVQINWTGFSCETIRSSFHEARSKNPSRPMRRPLFSIPRRLWCYILGKGGISPEERIGEIQERRLGKLCEILYSDCYRMEGKTTYKEEFVTCGGVTLSEVNFKTMESRVCPGLYLAGEILDIDGVTGGFNFQNAWTTGFIAGISSWGF